jgi:hypothetical protein
MENILPFLAALAYMAYKVYENYQKGQEEARTRNPSQPFEERSEEAYSEWRDEQTYIPEKSILDKEPHAPEKYHEPRYEPMLPTREPVKKEPGVKIPRVVELYNPEEPAEEVIRGREIHAPHKHKFVASEREEEKYADFDIEDAVIKEAILNRPQY